MPLALPLPFTKSPLLNKLQKLEHGFSNLACDATTLRELQQRTATVKQVHKDKILWVTRFEKAAQEADGIGTSEKKLPVGVFSADCVPLLFAAADSSGTALAILAVHAGWRGTALGIGGKGLRFFHRQVSPLGARKILVAIGPAISREAFEVGEEVVAAFPGSEASGIAEFFRIEGDKKKYRFDLPGENRRQLENVGRELSLPIEVDSLPDCTFRESSKYPSFRRDRENAGRILSFLALTE